MKKNIFFNTKHLSLIQVNCSSSHVKTLFNILKKRKFILSISHIKLPKYEEHKKFVFSNPYRYWFLIEKSKKNLGSFFITRNNEISINLIKYDEKLYIEILNFILTKIKPLKAISSKRSSDFICNISPNNKLLQKTLKKIRSEKIQETYKLNNLVYEKFI